MLTDSELCLCQKKGKWLLAKCSVDEGVINTIKLPGEKKGHNYQGNSPFLLGPLWPPQSKIDNMVEGGCSVAAHVLHLLFLLWLVCLCLVSTAMKGIIPALNKTHKTMKLYCISHLTKSSSQIF